MTAIVIDTFTDCISTRNSITYYGWVIKCHIPNARFVLKYWYVAGSVQLELSKEIAEHLVHDTLDEWVSQNKARNVKRYSAEIDFTLTFDAISNKLCYQYAYHKYIPEQDVIDHFNPFSIN